MLDGVCWKVRVEELDVGWGVLEGGGGGGKNVGRALGWGGTRWRTTTTPRAPAATRMLIGENGDEE